MATVELGRRQPLSRVFYNASIYGLAAAAAGLAGGVVDGTSLGALVGATLLAWVAFYAVNITLLAAIRMRAGKEPMLRVLRSFAASTAAPATILLSFAVIVVVLWDRSPLLIIALICPLGVIAPHERCLHAALHVSHELRTPLASVYGASMTVQCPDIDERVRASLLAIAGWKWDLGCFCRSNQPYSPHRCVS